MLKGAGSSKLCRRIGGKEMCYHGKGSEYGCRCSSVKKHSSAMCEVQSSVPRSSNCPAYSGSLNSSGSCGRSSVQLYRL